MRRLVRRWLTYNAVGLMGFGLQLSTLAVLTELLDVHYLWATLVAVETAILHNFAWHERWTWRDRPSDGARMRLRRLVELNSTTGLVSLVGNAAVMGWLVGSLAMAPLPANVLAVAACSLLNFLVSDRFVFRKAGKEKGMLDPLVLSNIVERPGRAVASVVGIALGVVLILVTVGLARGMLRSSGERQANVGAEILFQPPGAFHAGVTTSPLSLPVPYAEAIRGIEGVRDATPVGRYVQSGAGGLGFELVEGVVFASPSPSERGAYPAITGLEFPEGRAPAGVREAAIDRRRAASTETSIGDSIELLGHQFEVVGIYAPEVGARVKIPLAAMQELLGGDGKCSWILVKTEDPTLQESVARRIDAAFPGNQILFTRDIPSYFEKGIPSLNLFLNVVVGLATAISSLITLLAMYTAVVERTREIGILKSLGASKRFIVGAIEKEATALSVAGVLVGIGGSCLTQRAITRTTSLVVEIEPHWMAVAAVVAVTGGALGALYPALRAAHRDPVEALAHE